MGTASAFDTLMLFLTDRCNLACDYCYERQPEFAVHRRESLSAETGIRAVDLLFSSAGSGQLSLSFFGGEPLVEYPLLQQLTRYARQKADSSGREIEIGFTTNGSLLDRERIAWLKAHGVSFLLSMDGSPEMQDTHRRFQDRLPTGELLAGLLPAIIEHFPGQYVRMTVTPKNLPHFARSVQWLRDAGVQNILFAPDIISGWLDSDLELFADELQKIADIWKRSYSGPGRFTFSLFSEFRDSKVRRTKYACYAGRKLLSVSVDGTVWPCQRFATMRTWDVGTVFDGIDEARLEAFRRGLEIDWSSRVCSSCPIGEWCWTGCPAKNLEDNGELLQPSEVYCRLMKLQYELKQQVLNEMQGDRNSSFTREFLPEVHSMLTLQEMPESIFP